MSDVTAEIYQDQNKKIRNEALLRACEFTELANTYASVANRGLEDKIFDKIIKHPRSNELDFSQATALNSAITMEFATATKVYEHSINFIKAASGGKLQSFNVLCEAAAKIAREEIKVTK